MTFLPIVDRELRVRARNRATFRARVGAAVIAILIVGFFLLMAQAQFSPSRLGQRTFWILSTLAFIWCLTEGPRNTADSLSEEKRAGTLGLLFLTDLKSYDVVFGKLFASSLNSFYGVLAILPPLGIPLLLGGVTPGEFWRMVLLLVVTLFFSLSAGLLISAASRDERKAWIGTATLVASLTFIPPLFRWLPNPSTWLLAWCSPVAGFRTLGDAGYASRAELYWQSIAGVHLLSWGFLIAASLILPRTWQDKPVQQANREVRAGRRLRGEVERRRAMHLNPAVWMLTRGQGADWYVWAIILAIGIPSILAAYFSGGSGLVIGPLLGIALALNFALAVLVAAKACYMVFDARSSGAFELLVTTPLPTDAIVNGLMEGLKRQFRGPFVALCVMEVIIIMSFVEIKDLATTTGEFALVLLITLLACGLLAAQLTAIGWFGLWSGLRAKKAANAVVRTLLYVVVFPMVFMCCWFLWPIFAIAKDAIFINYARTKLHQQFRNIITEGVSIPKPPELWPRPGSWPPKLKLPNVLDK
jgi:hypothetical protein